MQPHNEIQPVLPLVPLGVLLYGVPLSLTTLLNFVTVWFGFFPKFRVIVPELHSGDETTMLVYKTIAKRCSSFA